MANRDTAYSFKGYYGMLKGIVTRTDDPDPELKRVQVCIPSYHGKVDKSIEKIGSGSNPGIYPWAQVCTLRFKTRGIASLLGGQTVEYPQVDDVIWLSFEGGDIRCPVYQGALGAAAGPLEALINGINDLFGAISGYSGLVSLAAEIIFAEEGVYDSVVGNDNGGISIGRIGWHEGRAQDILSQIYEANSTQFSSIAASNGASDLVTDLNMSSWSGYTVATGSPKYNAIKQILGTEESKKVQDQQVNKDISGYMEAGRKYGVTDPAALIYFADLHNQGGLGGALTVLKASSEPYTLDSLYNGSLTTYMGKYESRRTRVYNKIKELESSGQLSAAANNFVGDGTAQSRFLNVAKGYIGYNCTIFNEYFGNPQGTSWCAEFVSKCAYDAGLINKCFVKVAGAGDIPRYGVANGYGIWLEGNNSIPQPGDAVTFTWNGLGYYPGHDQYFSDHVGIVEYVEGSTVHTIEGNANGTNISSTVCRKTYQLYSGKINGYYRPNWSLAES